MQLCAPSWLLKLLNGLEWRHRDITTLNPSIQQSACFLSLHIYMYGKQQSYRSSLKKKIKKKKSEWKVDSGDMDRT